MTTAATAGAAAGLWIKVAVNLGSRKVTFRVLKSVIETLPGAELWPFAVKRAAAVGFLTMLWSGITEHTTDGVIAHLADEQLEDWAGWQGVGVEVGVFARWIRAHHLNAEDGKVRDWDDFAGALQTRRQGDAARKRAQREREAREAAEAARQAELQLGAMNGAEPARVVVEDIGTATRKRALALAMAANDGMHDNPALAGQFQPIVATRADGLDVAEFTIAEKCEDGDLLARVVYTIAKNYKPSKPGEYIRSLTYMKESSVRAYHRAVALDQIGKGKHEAVPDAVFTSSGNGSHASKANNTAAGALAAAAHRGLGE